MEPVVLHTLGKDSTTVALGFCFFVRRNVRKVAEVREPLSGIGARPPPEGPRDWTSSSRQSSCVSLPNVRITDMRQHTRLIFVFWRSKYDLVSSPWLCLIIRKRSYSQPLSFSRSLPPLKKEGSINRVSWITTNTVTKLVCLTQQCFKWM